MSAARESRWSGLRERLARSSRVFLIGVIVACGIEVLVDWNATLFEINVLRDRMRERGHNYASIVTRSAERAVRARDPGELDRLSAGLFDDEDLVYVRYSDATGATLHERLRDGYDMRFSTERGSSFVSYYTRQFDRDIGGILRDPEGLRSRIAHSRNRDFVQAWNDLVESVVHRFATPAPLRPSTNVILYQDRLRTPAREHDAQTTYALGTIVDPTRANVGVALVAFSMDRTNASIRTKYMKGLGMVLFFVGLILVQNLTARRDKLRLLDLETRYAGAKKAIRDALPPAGSHGGFEIASALGQSEGHVDGMLFDVFETGEELEIVVLDPRGDGIDAAAVSLHAIREYRNRRKDGVARSMVDVVGELGQSAAEIPLTRPVGVTILRVAAATGAIQGLTSPMGGIRIVSGTRIDSLEEEPASADAPDGVVGPLRSLRGSIESGATLLIACDGLAESDRTLEVGAVADFFVRTATTKEPKDLPTRITDVVAWARGKSSGLGSSDLLMVGATRA